MDENIMKEEVAVAQAEHPVLAQTETKAKKGIGILKDAVKKFGTRNIVVSASLVLILLAVVLNFVMFGNSAPTVSEGIVPGGAEDVISGEDGVGASAENEYFASAQLSRRQARDQALAVLQSVVDSTGADQTSKDQATVDISRITSEIEAEANIETLIKSKGFEDCIAVIGEGSASIIVRSDGLLPNELSQIKEIVWEQAGIEPVGIKIIEQSEL